MADPNPLERTVHGITADGGEIVRYDRAGKWRIEYGDGRSRAVKLAEAVDLAVAPGAQAWHRYGGTQFWAKVTKLQAQAAK